MRPVLFFIVSASILLLISLMGIEDELLFALSLFNAEIAALSLLMFKDEPFSIHKLVNIFVLLFFVFANIAQHVSNSIASSISMELTTGDYRRFQLVTLVILILYNFLYYVFRSKVPLNNKHHLRREISPNNLVVISTISIMIILWHFREEPIFLFFRGLEDTTRSSEESLAVSLLFDKVIRVFPFACYLLSIIYKVSFYKRVYLFILFLIALFPTSLSRNAVAMFWLPVMVLSFPFLRKPYYFVFSFFLIILFVFPFFDNFRYFNGTINIDFSLDYLNSPNYDTSQNFMIAMKDELVTNGRQLLGVLLFWVPRTIWPTKPVGSGSLLADQHFAFNNISMPFFGEGYVNFGFIGVLLFVIILAFFSSRIDFRYWSSQLVINDAFVPYYLVIIGSVIFIMRGDLLSSSAYTVGVLFSIFVVLLFSQKRRKREFTDT